MASAHERICAQYVRPSQLNCGEVGVASVTIVCREVRVSPTAAAELVSATGDLVAVYFP